MKHRLTETGDTDVSAAARMLPALLREAPIPVRRDWLLVKARQYLFLRIAAFAFTGIFSVMLIVQILFTPVLPVGTVLFSLPAMILSLLVASAMQRARRRHLDAAHFLHTLEQRSV
ncbi:MAG: hypothetical protein M5R41_04675 [Bacteroidia bacterium]|nr:hypothetical protein [Bacteroidia bacterium]